MRNLTRLFLFMTARLGLFVTLAAWIVGQWWFVDTQFSDLENNIYVSTISEDWCVTRIPTGSRKIESSAWIQPVTVPEYDADTMNITARQRRAALFEWIVLNGQPRPGNYSRSVTSWHFFGVSYFETRQVESVFVPHWQVITSFALFLGALMVVYRKRGKASAESQVTPSS